MSTRRTDVSGPEQSNRLKAVLKAGWDRNEQSTGVVIMPHNPGAVVPVPASVVPVDPGLWSDSKNPAPFLFQERKEFPRAVWSALPKDLPDKPDAYGNMVSYELDRWSGKEAIRGVRSGGNGPLSGTMRFSGASGKEYATEWIGPQFAAFRRQQDEIRMNAFRQLRGMPEKPVGPQVVDKVVFAGTSRESQSIASLDLSLSTAKAFSEELPPQLEGSPFLNKERDLYSSAHEYARIFNAFKDYDAPGAFSAFAFSKAGAEAPDKDIDSGVRIKMDSEGVRFHYDRGRTDFSSRSTVDGFLPDAVVYYPKTQAGWVKDTPAATVMKGDDVYVYMRQENGDIVLDALQSVGDLSKAPPKFEYREYEPGKTYNEEAGFSGAGDTEFAQRAAMAAERLASTSTAIASMIAFTLCALLPAVEYLDGNGKISSVLNCAAASVVIGALYGGYGAL